MPRKKSFTGDLFDTEGELFEDTGESQNVKPEQDDRATPSDQKTLTKQAAKKETKKTKQTDKTHKTHKRSSTNKQNKPQQTQPTGPTSRTSAARQQKETKSKRLNLLIRPGVFNKFAKIAYMQQASVNDLINQLIAEHVEKKPDMIREYDRLFKNRNAE